MFPTIDVEKLKLDFSTPARIRDTITAATGEIQRHLLTLSEVGGTNGDAILKAAADLERIDTSAKEAFQKAVKAEEIALAVQRTAPGHGKGSDDDLACFKNTLYVQRKKDGPLELRYTPANFNFSDKEGSWIKSAFDENFTMFSVLMLTEDDTAEWDERPRALLARFRALNDYLYCADRLMRGKGQDAYDAYMRRGGWQSLPKAGLYRELGNQLRLAMDTAEAGAGLEWVPTGVSATLIPDVRPEFGLLANIPTIPMPRSPYLWPVQGKYFRAYKAAEATSDTEASNRVIGPRDVATKNVTLTAVKIAAMVWDSTEIEEDSIVPQVAAIRADLGFAIEASKEWAWVNGQITAVSGTSSTFDTGETFADGASDGKEDDRRCWDGIRYANSLIGSTAQVDASAGFIAEQMTQCRDFQMDIYGQVPSDCFWLTGFLGKARLLVLKDAYGRQVVLTDNVRGGPGTFKTGTIGEAFGSGIVVSPAVSSAMNASGIMDGLVTNRTAIYCVNRRRLVHGEVRMTRLEATRDERFSRDQVGYKATYRGVGKTTVTASSTDPFVGAILGIN